MSHRTVGSEKNSLIMHYGMKALHDGVPYEEVTRRMAKLRRMNTAEVKSWIREQRANEKEMDEALNIQKLNWKPIDQIGSYAALGPDGKPWICPMLADGSMEDIEYAEPMEGYIDPEFIADLS